MAQRWIAEERVVFVHADGRRTAGRIAIGEPEPRGRDACCEVALEGMERSYTLVGASTLQALMLAIQLGGYRLHDFIAKGGRVLGPAGGDVALEALFGPLLRAAKVPGP